jgi:hypothetical protein
MIFFHNIHSFHKERTKNQKRKKGCDDYTNSLTPLITLAPYTYKRVPEERVREWFQFFHAFRVERSPGDRLRDTPQRLRALSFPRAICKGEF